MSEFTLIKVPNERKLISYASDQEKTVEKVDLLSPLFSATLGANYLPLSIGKRFLTGLPVIVLEKFPLVNLKFYFTKPRFSRSWGEASISIATKKILP